MSEDMATSNTTYMEGYAQREREALREELKQEVMQEVLAEVEAKYANQPAKSPDLTDYQSQTELCKRLGWTTVRLRNFLTRNHLEGISVGNAKLYNPKQIRQTLRKENAKMLAYINAK